MDVPWEILVASPDWGRSRLTAMILAQLGLNPIIVSTVNQCRHILATGTVGLVFCEPSFADGTYIDLLTLAACNAGKGKTRVVLTSEGNLGSSDYHDARLSG